MSPPTVALDTNALMMPVEADVDPFDELERLLGRTDTVVPEAVVRELDRLAEEGNATEARAARVGRRLADDRCRTLPAAEERDGADGALVALAAEGDVDYVVTSDGPLRDRLHAAGIPVISLRGQNTLAVIRP